MQQDIAGSSTLNRGEALEWRLQPGLSQKGLEMGGSVSLHGGRIGFPNLAGFLRNTPNKLGSPTS